MNNQSRFMCVVLAVAAVFIASTLIATTITEAAAKRKLKEAVPADLAVRAPIATSGDNAYITWWSNKTGNEEVMFRASTDNGATFGDKINLSNTTEADSDDAEIAASGNNVYVSWWERNETSDTPVARVSNDNGATFGPMLMLATNGTIGGGGG
jgi:Fe-S cluster assembly iron-binding protein IscA